MQDATRPIRFPADFSDRRVLEWSLLLAPALILGALLARPVWDVDIFWQLRLGEMILDRHGPIASEPFAASHLGEPLPAVAWLGQALLAGVRLLGGWSALRVFDALCWMGGFCAVAAACRRQGAAPGAVLLALLLAVVSAYMPAASVRPQNLAALCFGILLALLRLQWRPGLTIALAVPLLVLWQNLHPSVGVAAIALAAVATSDWYAWWRKGGTIPATASILAPVALVAMFVTPDGLSILAVSARNAEASLAINVAEWLPMWAPANRIVSLPVLLAAAITLWLVMRHPDRARGAELAVAAVLFAMTLVTARFVLFWAIAVIPVVARAAAEPVASRPGVSPWTAPIALAAAAFSFAVAGPTRFDASLPMSAIERLRQENVRGVIYADFPYGGPIIDAGYPDWRVAYDGRYYRYTSREWHFNGRVESGDAGLRDILRKWHVAGFLLKVSHNKPLTNELARAPGWERIWNRDGIVVYVPE